MDKAESKDRFLWLWRALFTLGCASFIFSFALPLLSQMNKGACPAIFVALLAGAAWLSTKLTSGEAKGLGLALIIFALDAAIIVFMQVYALPQGGPYVPKPFAREIFSVFGILLFVSFVWVLAGPMLNLKYAALTVCLALFHLVLYFFLSAAAACTTTGACF